MVPLSIRVRRPFAGLTFFRRDSRGDMTIVSRHWPHLLCWSWSLSWKWPHPNSGSHHTWGLHRHRHNGGGWYVVGPLWLTYQTYNRESDKRKRRGSYCVDMSKV